jgi:hypothetical protein
MSQVILLLKLLRFIKHSNSRLNHSWTLCMSLLNAMLLDLHSSRTQRCNSINTEVLTQLLSHFHPPPILATFLLKIHLSLNLSLALSSKCLFSSFPTKILSAFLDPILPMCPVHHSVLQFCILTLLDDLHESCCFSLC